MSDIIKKIIPADPYFTVSEELARSLADGISADADITFEISEKPQFIDCGGELEKIRCPLCGSEISMDCWGEMMEKAFDGSGFSDLDAQMPCCSGKASLNDLNYFYSCGFACFEISLLNFDGDADDICRSISEKTGTSFRVITAHI
ncbi:MAG: hypothetical protein IJ368_06590 [Oscillospiraceae bacterium]|nr:hypothetical protein [Oscillospiraceae bacterium]